MFLTKKNQKKTSIFPFPRLTLHPFHLERSRELFSKKKKNQKRILVNILNKKIKKKKKRKAIHLLLAYLVSILSWKVQGARTLHQRMQKQSEWNFSIILISYKSPISFIFNLVFRWFNSKFCLLYWAILLFCFWIKIQIKILIKLLPK